MNKAIKKQWVKALRSGEYKQGRDQLRNDSDRFCCLGVLCNLHAQAHPKIAAKQNDARHYMGEQTVLPPSVAKWAGLSNTAGGDVRIDDWTDDLASHNDAGYTFEDLANAIEEQL